MQKIVVISILLLVSVTCVNCSGQRSINDKLESLLIFPIATDIRVIKFKNRLEPDTTFANNVRSEITDQIATILPDVKTIQVKIDSNHLQEIYKAYDTVIRTAERKFKPKKIKAPDILLHLLDSANENFGLCIAHQGFLRTDENQSKEYTKSSNLQSLTFGIYGLEPISSASIMFCFIIDRKQKTLCFYDKEMWKERNPIEPTVIKSQLRNLLRSYF